MTDKVAAYEVNFENLVYVSDERFYEDEEF